MRLRRLLGLAFLLTASAVAVDPLRTMSQYVRQKWTVENGFPRGPVYSINQTSDGYLWIGGERGLFRFDGSTFQQMQSGNAELPALTHVLGLLADRDGGLWTRLRRPNLLLYRDGEFSDRMTALGHPRSSVAAMGRAYGGELLLWVLEGEGRALLLQNGKLETVATPSGFSRSPVLAIAQTEDGYIWVGTRDSGLFRLKGNETLKVIQGLPDLKVNTLVAGRGNQLWVGTDAGVVRWNGSRLTKEGLSAPLDEVQALAMALDKDSNLWVGANSNGLARSNAHGISFPDAAGPTTSNAVTALFEDREGNLWVGSDGVLEQFRDSPFVSYSYPEGVPSDGSNPIFVDDSKRTWFAPVQGGLGWMKEGKHGQIATGGLERDVIYSIAGKNGELWLGRQHGGLTRLRWNGGADTPVTRTYTRAQGLAQDSVSSVYLATDGSVWAGTLSGGVSKLGDGVFTNYTIANGLKSNTINSILESSDGAMWFATSDGVSSLAKGSWNHYSTQNGLPAKEVNCLLQDSSGIIWIGTASGLAYRGASAIQVAAGRSSSLKESILGLAEDQSGWLWIATSDHVLRVNREKLIKNELSDGDIQHFGLADGLRGVEGVKRHRSVVEDPSGRIWFSLNRGISVVDPARLRRNSAPAIAHLQKITADGASIPVTKLIHLPGGRQRVIFSYAGLCFAAPDRMRFRYKLEGFDQDWSEPVSTREAIYTNLAPGPYRFHLRASNPDGVWTSQAAITDLRVDPLFWQTWWFRLIVLGVILSSILVFYRFRMHQVSQRLNLIFEERLAERTRIAQELHDTLLQGFLSASMQISVATDGLADNSHVKPTLTRALELMRQVIAEGRNAVRGLRMSNNSSLDLERAFAQVQGEFLNAESDTQPSFQIAVDGEQRPLRPVLRDEVYRIGREALINAFRHSQAKTIEMELNYSSSQLQMLVRDDGRGIEPEVLRSGRDGHWGLLVMRERAERIGAKLQLFSSSSAGTEIVLSIPGHVAFQDHRKKTTNGRET